MLRYCQGGGGVHVLSLNFMPQVCNLPDSCHSLSFHSADVALRNLL